MAYDQNTRNRLQRFVNEARNLLSQEFTRQFQQKYGLDASSGEVSELERLVHLDDRELETARMLRGTLAHYLASSPSGGKRECLERMIREQAFTVLNRLSALRMAEARDIIIESLSRTYNSKGFQLYARLAGTALGDTGDAYRTYIFSLFDELALDLPVLFDRFSPQGCMFPGEEILLELLTMMNESDLSPLWAEDETIGWIYQYFNTLDERRQMRAESQAPRTSRELAVRNQFFTPRYVVEFLTDNTLGRLWYEMTQGRTKLMDSCHYIVRRPREIFLDAGEEYPELEKTAEDLSQEELLQQTVYIPYRRLKDPREILMLDPACGSMHFGLYAFDLYEKIYEEAWDLESQLGAKVFERSENLPALQQDYASKEKFLKDIPRLIVECNLHGVDIDSRAVQIAELSLWLRAQRSWQFRGVKPLQRPQIRKSNIVCAEPMPGEKGMLEEFTRSLKPRVLGQLEEIIFEKMQLAGEAGSLLKIEEEIEDAINLAREEFQKEIQFRNEGKSTLFSDVQPIQRQGIFDFSDLKDKTRFWNFAEQNLLNALREYADQAEGMEAAQKRLFTQDASRGFAFIDILRKQYDVVLMNPPFGQFSKKTKSILENAYTIGRRDIYASFLIRGSNLLTQNGLMGALTNRTFLTLGSYTDLRHDHFLKECPIRIIADLGSGVLDNAMVETACSIVGKSSNERRENIYFFKVAGTKEKADSLLSLLNNPIIFNLKVFENLPNNAFAYWLPRRIMELYARDQPIEGNAAHVRVGLQTSDDFRFVRLSWEVDRMDISRNNWVTFAKGGEFSPYYDDIHLVVDWANNGRNLKGFVDIDGKLVSVIRNSQWYFKPGLTFPWRTSLGFAPRVLMSNCIFAAQGSAILPLNENIEKSKELLLKLLGVLNSRAYQVMVSIGVGAIEDAAKSYQVGLIQSLPWPYEFENSLSNKIEHFVLKAINYRRSLDIYDETSRLFIVPSNRGLGYEKARTQKVIDNYQSEIDSLVEELLGIDLCQMVPKSNSNELTPYTDHYQNVLSESIIDTDFLKYFFGCIFGRWDIRFATGEKERPELPEPFAPLFVCPPGMLQNDQGLPANQQDLPDYYPLRISWSGILVDDEGQPEDIVAWIREAIEVIWKGKVGDIEHEFCEILRINSLRDYFRKPSNFFAEHLKGYSKSRRQAPIYWPLTTSSGSYTIWLYYHRLTDQTLYRCVNDYVEPKLKQLMESTRQLRQMNGRSRLEEKEFEELLNLEQELQEYRDELLRVAAFWKPDLNDGVQITAAPLWKLFRLPKWRSTLKDTWEKLEKGDYDWAHLALSIWPERVKKKCMNDKSLAIAHDLENIYKEPVDQAKKKGGRGKKNV